ncbi:sodium:proton antiporter [Microbulbifer sp. Q7]|uniref:cation:proton antiporter n=1 Tax=Microbulbifer sp. Q7 TaxID=1785091 RepID=UPI0009ECD73C|nr:cation:proton antiporter [Microbulbifer sp. Q7]
MSELFKTVKLMEAYDLTLVVLGLGILALAALLHRFKSLPFSFPILSLALGYVAFALPLGLTPPDPRQHGSLTVHLTEIGVIISLMGVGLKIDRLPNLRTWSTTWRLLGICMPLTIAGVAWLGWWVVGLAPAAAVLLAAALAPTDPVLAADVQLGEPEPEVPDEAVSVVADDRTSPEKPSVERDDELRFTLTSEAGLNDSLAFPFTFLALLMLTEGLNPENWFAQWFLIDVLYRIAVGVIAGAVVGWGLSHVLLRLSVDSEQEKMRTGVGALAATLLLYGVTECVGGYGFLAVFIGGLTIRNREHTQQSHQSMHTFAEQAEQLLMTCILIALGGAIAGGLLDALTWPAAVLSMLLIFVVRPAAGFIGLMGAQSLSVLGRVIASFYGIRGIGCLFYLAYGLQKGNFGEEDLLWATCAFAVVLSIFVHGVTASPVIRLRDRKKRLESKDLTAE